jgi:hypothetical protein
MAKDGTSNFVLGNLRGGMNDQDPAQSLPDDQVVLAENVEFFFSTLGERRRGCEAVDITGSGLGSEAEIVHLNIHLPKEAAIKDNELWAAGATQNASITLAHRVSGAWSTVVPVDAFATDYPSALRIQSQSLHGKFFIAAKNAADRLHVWDGNTLRRTGLAQPPAAPNVVDDSVGGSYTGVRIFRIRYVALAGSVVLRRSEPSAETTFTPLGTKDGAVITRPALINEGETHWEVEASDGDGNFYVIATVAVATTTYLDTTQPATEYANIGTLSEDIGTYDTIESVKYIKADQDRLVFGGSWTTVEHNSRVSWTPVWADPGVGNDERIPLETDNFIDLDWMDGGELTGISEPINGAFYAFKWTRIYKLQRSGNVNHAYEAFLLSPYRGAMYGSIVSGTDEFGKGCVYFLDPSLGPMRVGAQGLQHIQNIRGTWRHVNTAASFIVSHGVYYPDKMQVHWWVAVDGSDTPNKKLVLQVNEVRSTQDGTERGWVIATGRQTEAWCSTIVPEVIIEEDTLATLLSYRPYCGLTSPDFIQRCDTGSEDAGHKYRAKILSKPYILVGLLNRWGAMTAALLASPLDDPEVKINVKFVRDFGIEENLTTTDFTPESNETLVIKPFDSLSMSSARAIQVQFEDV